MVLLSYLVNSTANSNPSGPDPTVDVPDSGHGCVCVHIYTPGRIGLLCAGGKWRLLGHYSWPAGADNGIVASCCNTYFMLCSWVPPADPCCHLACWTAAELQAALDRHNVHRARHGARPLTWNTAAAAVAQAHANRCVFQHNGNRGNLGENIAMGHGSLTAAVDDWYNEVSLVSLYATQ